MTMICKRAWKLVMSPVSLIIKLLRARYYFTSDYFASSVGHIPSYVWRAIWSEKEIVQRGFKWSIDTCTNILIWDHHWIQSGQPIEQPHVMRSVMQNLTVSDLLI